MPPNNKQSEVIMDDIKKAVLKANISLEMLRGSIDSDGVHSKAFEHLDAEYQRNINEFCIASSKCEFNKGMLCERDGFITECNHMICPK
jgi:hypothetical protein